MSVPKACFSPEGRGPGHGGCLVFSGVPRLLCQLSLAGAVMGDLDFERGIKEVVYSQNPGAGDEMPKPEEVLSFGLGNHPASFV